MHALEIAVGSEAAKALIVVGSICYGSRKGSGTDSFGQKGPACFPTRVNVSRESRIAGSSVRIEWVLKAGSRSNGVQNESEGYFKVEQLHRS